MKRFTLLASLFLPAILWANGLTITNLSRDSLAQTVTFDVQWHNSWRLDSTGAPNNWDAAWVFVKFQTCSGGSQAVWEHGQLSTTLTDHTFGDLEPILSDGSGLGIDAAPYNTGVLLRRNRNGLFASEPATTITLSVPNMLPNEAYNVRVVGIEMVFVPQGAYELGSVTYSNAFASSPSGTNTIPLLISNEAAQTITSHAGGANNSVALSAAFPKGYDPFHLMKYEITQGQYATFLNSLSSNYQYNRYPGNFGSYRHELGAGGTAPDVFVSSRPDRAQNYLSWEDVMAYLDWAALRPLTEMEYEKACRGLDPMVADEYAWGDNSAAILTTVTGPENGTEIPGVLPANAHYNNTNLAGGDGGRGPVRVGLFALPTTNTRNAAGAGYYATFEMSGNVAEPYVKVHADNANYAGLPGDGLVDGNGNSNEAGWPTTADAAIPRGGGFNHGANYLRISDRSLFSWDQARVYWSGGRGGR